MSLSANKYIFLLHLAFSLLFSGSIVGYANIFQDSLKPVFIAKENLHWNPEEGDLKTSYEGNRKQWQDMETYWKVRMGGAGDWSQFRFDIPLAGTYNMKFKAVPTSRGSKMQILINNNVVGSYNHAGDEEEVIFNDVVLKSGENKVRFVVTGSNSGTYFYQQIAGLDFLPPGESVYGEHYGSSFTKAATGDPLGGGKGYSRIISVNDADYIIRTLEELEDALSDISVQRNVSGKANDNYIIYIDDDAEIDMSSRAKEPLEIPANVTLASGRGFNGSLGGKLFTSVASSKGLFKTTGPNVRFTGLRIEGDDPDRHDELKSSYALPLSQGIYSEHYVEVDNCEVSAFSFAGIRTNNAYIHHNYLHHSQRKGLGYLIALDHLPETKGYVLAEGNIFEKFRHAIAGMGAYWERYEARYNTFKDGTLHHLDMHSKDEGKSLPDGGIHIAGQYVKIHHNTFYDDFMYYNKKQEERNAPHVLIYIRGVPFEGAYIDYNEFADLEPEDGYQAMLQNNSYGNFFVGKNKYGPKGDILEGQVRRSYSGRYPSPEFSLSNVVIRNRDGQHISTISEANGFINISAEIGNLNRIDEEIAFIVALKGKDGQVEHMARVERTLGHIDKETIEIGFKLPADVSGYSVEIYALNNDSEETGPATDIITFR